MRSKCKPYKGVRAMVFNANFNNISVISWQSVLLVEETGVSGKFYILSFLIQNIISNVFIFSLISQSDIVSINKFTLILINYRCDIKHAMMSSIKIVTSVMKVLTYIITSTIILSYQILAIYIVIVSVLNFKNCCYSIL